MRRPTPVLQTDGDLRKEAVEAILAIEWPVCPTMSKIASDAFSSYWVLEKEEKRIVSPLLNHTLNAPRRRMGPLRVSGGCAMFFRLRRSVTFGGELNVPEFVVLPARYESVSALLIRANPASEEANEVNRKAVVNLIQALSDNANPVARLVAARMLGEIGPRAKPAVPVLLNAARDRDDDVRKAAVFALGKIAPKDAG